MVLLWRIYKFKKMENVEVKNPKDERVTNDDDAVTNKDGNNYLEKGRQPTNQDKPDKERVPTVTPDNDNGKPGPPDKDDAENKDGTLEKENL
jgi:hypothetical protein